MKLLPYNPTFFAGSNAVFTCNAQSAIGVQWYINGTQYTSIGIEFSEIVGIGVLRINSISIKFNQTSVQCEVDMLHRMQRSSINHIMVQGKCVIKVVVSHKL